MTPTPNPQPPLVISEEARACSEALQEKAWTLPPVRRTTEGYEEFTVNMAKDIEPFINQATEKIGNYGKHNTENMALFTTLQRNKPSPPASDLWRRRLRD